MAYEANILFPCNQTFRSELGLQKRPVNFLNNCE